MKRWVFVFLVFIATSLAVWGLWKIIGPKGTAQQAQKMKPKPLVVAQVVELGEISNVLELTGSVEPTRVARLASPAEGPIRNCRVREGDQVRQGAKILSIGRRKATEALLLSANQDLKTEKEELVSVEKLVESGAIPRDQLELARAKYDRAVAQLERVKESSDDYEVVAPWDGIISKVLVADGNFVVPRTVMVEIFDPKSLVIRTAAPEAQSQDLRLNMDVSVKLDAYPGKSFQGKISRIYPELDRRTRTRTVEIELIDTVNLTPGMFARINLALKSESAVVVVPLEAVMVTPRGLRVAYVVENGKAMQRKVTTGIEGGGRVQILSGIKPGELIVTAGNEKLKDGIEIRLQPTGAEKQSVPSTPKDGASSR